MIPVRLRLENFLSYRAPDPIDFTGFDVACLTGSNGQGKSAILDAMTWALFGCARGCEGGQNQDRLIRDGADRATVDFWFELGDATYRIVRSRTRTKADLQLMVRDGEAWTNIAGESLSETQARIAQVIHMDYTSFVASAFLLQGRADDFLTRMKPEERKEVFAGLLDLGVYERLEEAARSHGREAEGRRKELESHVLRLKEECAGIDRAREDLERARERAVCETQALRVAEDQLKSAREELARLEQTAALAERERTTISNLSARIEQDRAALSRAEAELAQIADLEARLPEVRAALAESARLEGEDELLRAAAERAGELEAKQVVLLGRVDAERAAIQSRRAAAARAIQTIGARVDVLVRDRGRLEEIERALAESDGVDATLLELRTSVASLLGEHGELGARIDALGLRDTERAERLDLLKRGDATCPVCEGPLDAAHRKQLTVALTAEARAATKERKAIESRRAEVTKEGKRLREEETRIAVIVSQRTSLAATGAEIRSTLDALPSLEADLADRTAEDEADAALLASEGFAAAERGELEAVRTELAASVYDRPSHDAVRARLSELSSFRELLGRIEASSATRPAREGERDTLTERLRTEQADLADHARALADLGTALADAASIRTAEAEAAVRAEAARAAASGAEAAVVRLGEQVLVLERKAEDLVVAQDAEREAADERRRYQRLGQSFGRGGIPDLIIENALPELGWDANEILERLTDGEMSIQFVMDKPTKSGKTKDTFDVLVEHDGHIREFQMFSGGEAYRIAFAIRLALSKLLVRRAGARLETLVIDEGFGTQDAGGRERLMETINLARRDFRKILVISHLDEMKDAFPAQIRISKDPSDGSTVQVLAG